MTITAPAKKIINTSSIFIDDKEYSLNVANNPNTMNMEVNYAASNLWFAHFPLEDCLGSKYRNLDIHLTLFALPQLMLSTTTVSYRGYEKEIPTKVLDALTKELTLTYIVDDKWRNYRSLFSWLSGIRGTINPITKDTADGILPSDYLPLRIYLLDNFKNKIIQFLFENCWIKIFNELLLDVNNPGVITHSFTVAYERYTIEDI